MKKFKNCFNFNKCVFRLSSFVNVRASINLNNVNHFNHFNSLPYSGHVINKRGSPEIKFFFIMMELCEGATLDKLISKETLSNHKDRFNILLQVANCYNLIIMY